MLKAILERVVLFFVPIALGYLWRWATEGRRSGAQPTSPPPMLPLPPPSASLRPRTLAWLAAAGAILVGASLIGGALWPRGPDRSVYVPAEVRPGGDVAPGHFESARKP